MQTERSKIITEYHSAVRAYQEAVSQLNGLNQLSFERQWTAAEKCREACEEIRLRLDNLDRARDSEFKAASATRGTPAANPAVDCGPCEFE